MKRMFARKSFGLPLVALLLALAAQGQTSRFDAVGYARRLDNRETRSDAHEEIRFLPDDEPVPQMLGIFQACKDPIARRCMAELLGNQRGPAAADALTTLLKDPDERVRNIATEALAKRHDPRALTPLKDWLRGSTIEEARRPGRLLVQDKEPGVQCLVSLIREGNPETIHKALIAIHEVLTQARWSGFFGRGRGSSESTDESVILGTAIAKECLPDLLRLARTTDDKKLRQLVWETIAATPGTVGAEAVWKHIQNSPGLPHIRIAVLLCLVSHPLRGAWLEQYLEKADPESAGVLALGLLDEQGVRAIDAIVKAARRLGPPPPPPDNGPRVGSPFPSIPLGLMKMRGGGERLSIWHVLMHITDSRVKALALAWARQQRKLPSTLVRVLLVQRQPFSVVPKLLTPTYDDFILAIPRQTTIIGHWGSKVVPILQKAADPNSPPNVRRNAICALTAAGEESVLPLLNSMGKAKKWADRRVAVECLDLYWDIRSVPILLELAQDENGLVRTLAFEALRSFHEPETVPALMKLYRTSGQTAPSANEKDDILAALAPLETPGMRNFMLDFLNEAVTHEPALIEAVLKWRGWRHAPPPFEQLERAMNWEKDGVSKALTKALAAFPPERVVQAIARRLKGEDRGQWSGAVARLADMLPHPLAEKALLSAMHHGDWKTSFLCAEALVQDGGERCRSQVFAFVPRSRWPTCQKNSMLWEAKRRPEPAIRLKSMVRKLSAAKAKAFLAEKLTDPDREVRIAAAYRLSELGDPRGETEIIEALRDPTARYEWAAVKAVKALRTPALVDALLARFSRKPSLFTLLAVKELGEVRAARPVLMRLAAEGPLRGLSQLHSSSNLWAEAIRAIAPMGGEDVYSLIASQLKEILTWRVGDATGGEGEYPYFSLIRAAGDTHDPRFIPVLLQACYDPAVDPRTVAEALGAIQDPRAVEALLDLARRPPAPLPAGCWNLPSTCGVALGRIACHAPTVRSRITSLLTSANWRLRQCAVQACGELGDNAPRHIVRQALIDPQPDVRQAAADAVGRLGMAELKPTLEKLAENSPYWYVRRSAKDSLTRLAGKTPESWW